MSKATKRKIKKIHIRGKETRSENHASMEEISKEISKK